MGYKVDFQGLDYFGWGIFAQAYNWELELEDTYRKTKAIIDSTYMSGKGADEIRSYMTNVHVLLQGMILQLITLHKLNYLRYKVDYTSNIDREYHARIHQDELNTIKESLYHQGDEAMSRQEELDSVLRAVSGFFSTTYRHADAVVEAHQAGVTALEKLDCKIQELEHRHLTNDFVETSEYISNLRSHIYSLFGRGREYKTMFSAEEYKKTETFSKILESYLAVNQKLTDESADIQRAANLDADRMRVVEQDYQDRKTKATWVKIGATTCVLLVSIPLVMGSGGTATPLVMAQVSGLGAMGTTTVDYMADVYLKDGDLSHMSVGDLSTTVAQESLKSGASAAVSTVVGGKMGDVLNGTKIPPAVVGSVSEVVGGVTGRATESLMAGEEVEDILGSTFSADAIVTDAVAGGAGRVVGDLVPGPGKDAASAGMSFGIGASDKAVETIFGYEEILPEKPDGVN